MEENCLRVSNKELFYSAMLLRFDQLVNVEYYFPAGKGERNAELEDVKKSLHRKKLLKVNSKGEATLDERLSDCAAFCAKPDICVVVDEEGFYATIYIREGACMLLEKAGEDENAARWFMDRREADSYVVHRVAGIPEKEEIVDGVG